MSNKDWIGIRIIIAKKVFNMKRNFVQLCELGYDEENGDVFYCITSTQDSFPMHTILWDRQKSRMQADEMKFLMQLKF